MSAMRVATNSHHDDLSILQSVIQDEWKQHDPSPSDSEWIYLRKDRIKRKRGVFKCLPVYFSNDLVHGSWWFTIGSAFTVVIALIPLAGPYFQWNELKKNELPILQDPVTFNVTIISGIIYTLGSLAFVRAAEEPPLKPLFQCSHHISTDELLAAWLFFLGSLPEPLLLVYYIYQYPTVLFYWGSLVASICFMAATFAFVLTCYPSAFPDKSLPTKSYVRQYVVKFCCPENVQLLYHLSNDWLAATWLFFFCSLLLTIGSAGMLIDSLFKRRRIDAILWLLSTIDAIAFLVGSAYFCAGSYGSNSNNSNSNNISDICYNGSYSDNLTTDCRNNSQKSVFRDSIESDPLISNNLEASKLYM